MKEQMLKNIYIGAPGDGRREKLLSQAINIWADDIEPGFVFLVPAKTARRTIEKELMGKRGRGFFNSPVYTLDTFVLKIHKEKGGAERVSSEFQSALIASLITGNKMFEPKEHFLPYLVRLFDRMEYADRNIKDIATTSEAEKAIREIFGEYRKKLSAYGFEDSGGMMRAAIKILEEEKLRWKAVFIEGFYDLAPLRKRFFKSLVKCADSAVISIDLPDEIADAKKLPQQALNFWQETLNVAPEKAEPIKAKYRDLAKRIFTFQDEKNKDDKKDKEDKENNEEPMPEFRFFSTRVREVEAIAERIALLHSQKNVPWTDITVAFPAIENYASLVEEIFSRFSIPHNTDCGKLLAKEPLTGAVFAMLKYIVKEGREDLFAVLSSPYFQKPNADGERQYIDLKTLHNITCLPPVFRGSKKDWFDAIGKHLNFKSQTEDKYRYNKIKNKAKEIKPELENFFDLLPELKEGFFDCVKKILALAKENISSEREEKILKTLESVADNLRQSVKGNIKSEELLGLFRAVVEGVAPYPEKSGDGIFVCKIAELAGAKLKYLMLGGLAEGEFPQSEPIEPFFKNLLPKTDRYDEASFLLYYALSATKENIFLTSPALSEGHEEKPSQFILNVKNIAGKKEEPIVKKETDKFFDYRSFEKKLADYLTECSFEKLPMITSLTYNDEKAEGLRLGVCINILRHYHLLFPLKERFSVYEGRIEKYKEIIAEKEKTEKEKQEKIYSPSQIKEYNDCPFKYFLKNVLRLEAAEELSPMMSSLECGNIIHRALAKFYQDWKDKEKPLPLKEESFEDAWKNLKQFAEEEFKKYPREGFHFEVVKEKFLEGEDPLLQKFIRAEIADAEKKFVPSEFERWTGYGDEIVCLPGTDFRIGGKIDRVDISEDGTDFRVIDYKVSSVAKWEEPQLLIYIFAMRQIKNVDNARTGKKSAYYLIDIKEEGKCKKREGPDFRRTKQWENWDEWYNDRCKNAEEVIANIQNGEFSPTPDYHKCGYCGFSYICRSK